MQAFGHRITEITNWIPVFSSYLEMTMKDVVTLTCKVLGASIYECFVVASWQASLSVG